MLDTLTSAGRLEPCTGHNAGPRSQMNSASMCFAYIAPHGSWRTSQQLGYLEVFSVTAALQLELFLQIPKKEALFKRTWFETTTGMVTVLFCRALRFKISSMVLSDVKESILEPLKTKTKKNSAVDAKLCC